MNDSSTSLLVTFANISETVQDRHTATTDH